MEECFWRVSLNFSFKTLGSRMYVYYYHCWLRDTFMGNRTICTNTIEALAKYFLRVEIILRLNFFLPSSTGWAQRRIGGTIINQQQKYIQAQVQMVLHLASRIGSFALLWEIMSFREKKSSLLKWDSYRSISSARQKNRF